MDNNNSTASAQQDAPVLGQMGNPLSRIWTAPNVITFIRFLMIPLFFILMISTAPKIYAIVVFAVAACTDWIDGQIARRTNQVSRIGQAVDPFVDRFLIGFGILGIVITDQVPLWMFVVIVGRDIFLGLCSAAFKRNAPHAQLHVIYLGKITTALLLFGFVSVMLGWPLVGGLGVFNSVYFPGWGSTGVAFGMWFIYIAIITSVTTAAIYIYRGRCVVREYRKQQGLSGKDR